MEHLFVLSYSKNRLFEVRKLASRPSWGRSRVLCDLLAWILLSLPSEASQATREGI